MSLTLDQIKDAAPSVFTGHQRPGLSQKYTFIPSSELVEEFVHMGWVPVEATEKHSRKPNRVGFQKHMIRFRMKDHVESEYKEVGDLIPEILMTNSHDGRNAFHLHAGIFRLVCTNGLIVGGVPHEEVYIRHMSYTSDEAQASILKTSEQVSTLIKQIGSYKKVFLANEKKRDFAEVALKIKFRNRMPSISANQLLESRREGDRRNDLWTVFNVIQENLMKGGLEGVTASGRRVRTRGIKNINENLRINKSLWEVTEKIRRGEPFTELLN